MSGTGPLPPRCEEGHPAVGRRLIRERSARVEHLVDHSNQISCRNVEGENTCRAVAKKGSLVGVVELFREQDDAKRVTGVLGEVRGKGVAHLCGRDQHVGLQRRDPAGQLVGVHDDAVRVPVMGCLLEYPQCAVAEKLLGGISRHENALASKHASVREC